MREMIAPDATQLAILPHLRTTEELIGRVASRISGRACDAEIIPMPDLGIPHNVRRMHGGFFTGALYCWEADVPMVPVDSTVNVCGVALFRTSTEIATENEFHERVKRARSIWEDETPFSWNFDTGNHFIIYAESDGRDSGFPSERYLVLHASAGEFKSQFNGLYPSGRNWYSDKVKVFSGKNNRYLRYVSGRVAERFYDVAAMLTSYQVQRQRLLAGLMVGEGGIESEELSLPHYGMPDQQSVAIGCQWLTYSNPNYLLLTRPHAPLYLVKAHVGGRNGIRTDHGDRLVTPHGLGVRSRASEVEIEYLKDHLRVASNTMHVTESMRSGSGIEIRDFVPDRDLAAIFAHCPGSVEKKLYPKFSYFWKGNNK